MNQEEKENEVPKPNIGLIIDPKLESLGAESYPDTADWEVAEDITSIDNLISSVNNDDTRKELARKDLLVIALGATEMIGGDNRAHKKYIEAIISTAKLTKVAVVELPNFSPAGNLSGSHLFNMNVSIGIPKDVQYIRITNIMREENRKEVLWSSNIDLNDKGITCISGIIKSELIIPEPKKPDVVLEGDTDDDISYTELPKGTSGGILRDSGRYVSKITRATNVRISVGDWSERRSKNIKDSAIISGNRSNRREAKKRLLRLANDVAAYNKRNKRQFPK